MNILKTPRRIGFLIIAYPFIAGIIYILFEILKNYIQPNPNARALGPISNFIIMKKAGVFIPLALTGSLSIIIIPLVQIGSFVIGLIISIINKMSVVPMILFSIDVICRIVYFLVFINILFLYGFIFNVGQFLIVYHGIIILIDVLIIYNCIRMKKKESSNQKPSGNPAPPSS